MTCILEYIDDTTKKVVELIVEQYKKDLFDLKYLPSEQRDGVGITLGDIIFQICDCHIIKYESSFCVKYKIPHDISLKVQEDTAYSGNLGFLNQTKALQIINFIIQLSQEGYIVLTEFGNSKAYPSYKGVSENDMGYIYLPIRNQKINSFLELAYYSHVCPTSTLEKFRENSFKTVEKQRYFWTQVCSWVAIIVAIAIGIISISEKNKIYIWIN